MVGDGKVGCDVVFSCGIGEGGVKAPFLYFFGGKRSFKVVSEGGFVSKLTPK